MFRLLLLTLLALESNALPVIFKYHSDKTDYEVAGHSKDSSDKVLFVAGFNKPLKRPMSIHGDAVAYNVDEKDLPNFIPADPNQITTTPMPINVHSYYREVVTRSTRGHDYLVKSSEVSEDQNSNDVSKRYPLTEKVSTGQKMEELDEKRMASKVGKSTGSSMEGKKSTEDLMENKKSTGFSMEESKSTEKLVEECYGNVRLLHRRTVRKMNKKRRKLAQAIRKLNKLQRSFCLKKRLHEDSGKCSTWRTEKMALYVKLMQLTHCIRPTAQPVF
ncbi:unnamed protein product [Bursaphelenchus okinawaensis]|uniref:BZIP domain-containing protein n=1 Tax=Bursaphelenchus okinawaensis TaxID=465554 RepID=A0A811L7G9_9BILA|nr:unnamed protein product [Bursaphelenchus okinawaensis]CAG9118287.1 unnamed protein product [Bursaphelenchus okinawaensis]